MKQPFWKVKHDFLCLKIIGMLDNEKYSISDIHREIRALMDFTTLENIEKYDIIEKRRWVTINHKHIDIGGDGDSNNGKTKVIKDIEQIGIKGIVNIPPKKIDVDNLNFDSVHINERNHNVSLEEAKSFIKNADISLTRWNRKFENYYGKNGAAYVDVTNNLIRTAFKATEYDDKTKEMIGVIEKWKNG